MLIPFLPSLVLSGPTFPISSSPAKHTIDSQQIKNIAEFLHTTTQDLDKKSNHEISEMIIEAIRDISYDERPALTLNNFKFTLRHDDVITFPPNVTLRNCYVEGGQSIFFHKGTLTATSENVILWVKGEGAEGHVQGKNSKVFAQASNSTAYADGPKTKAYGNAKNTRAYAGGPDRIAHAVHEGAHAHAYSGGQASIDTRGASGTAEGIGSIVSATIPDVQMAAWNGAQTIEIINGYVTKMNGKTVSYLQGPEEETPEELIKGSEAPPMTSRSTYSVVSPKSPSSSLPPAKFGIQGQYGNRYMKEDPDMLGD